MMQSKRVNVKGHYREMVWDEKGQIIHLKNGTQLNQLLTEMIVLVSTFAVRLIVSAVVKDTATS